MYVCVCDHNGDHNGTRDKQAAKSWTVVACLAVFVSKHKGDCCEYTYTCTVTSCNLQHRCHLSVICELACICNKICKNYACFGVGQAKVAEWVNGGRSIATDAQIDRRSSGVGPVGLYGSSYEVCALFDSSDFRAQLYRTPSCSRGYADCF